MEHTSKQSTTPLGNDDYWYRMGKDCALNGSNMVNSNYKLFDTKEHTAEWERGKKDGDNERGKVN